MIIIGVYYNQEAMNMAGEFNFEITTKYKPEFKEQIKNASLYKVLIDEILIRDSEEKKDYIDYTE